jgi:hypothetical protein
MFLFCTETISALGPTQPAIQWILRALSLGVKWQGHKPDHSPRSRMVEIILQSSICLHTIIKRANF